MQPPPRSWASRRASRGERPLRRRPAHTSRAWARPAGSSTRKPIEKLQNALKTAENREK